MAVPIKAGGSNNLLEVDSHGSAQVLLFDQNGEPLVLESGGLVTGAKTGVPIVGYDEDIARTIRVGRQGGLGLNRVNQPLFHDIVDGAAVNTQQWAQTLTTMTAVQANRIVTLNAGNSVAATVVATHTSLAVFPKVRETTLRLSARMRFNWTASGATMQVGFGVAGTTVEQVQNGVFFRITTGGAIHLVYASNSADVVQKDTGVAVGGGGLDPAKWYDVDLFIGDDSMRLVVHHSDGDNKTAPVIDSTLSYAVAQPTDTLLRALPVMVRILNVTAPSTASQLQYSNISVMQQDVEEGRLIGDALARAGRAALINPSSGAQLANYANSAAPASATLSNTAAGYTTLGGQWQFAAVAGAETDYALFAFVVPTGYTLHIKSVRIDAFIMGAAVATTATLLQWFIDRASAATLATNSFRKTLGVQSFPVGAAIGQAATPIEWYPDVPHVVESGQTLHIALKMPVGTATASSIIRGTVSLDGYLE